LGQLNLLLLLLLTAVWLADRRGSWVWSGFWLGLAAAIKLFPGFMVLYWLVKRDWRPVISFMASFAICAVATAAVLGVDTYRQYVAEAMPALRPSWSGWSNVSLFSLWMKLFDPHPQERVEPLIQSLAAAWLSIAISAVAIVGTNCQLASTYRKGKPAACRDNDRIFAVTMLAMLLLSPVTWSHYLVLLWLPAAILWPSIAARRSFLVVYGVCIVAFWPTPLPLWKAALGWPDGVAAPWQTLTILAYPTYALLGLWVVAIAAGTRLDAQHGST
jgi:alpha-1,2-mannosyltransferase